MGRTRIVFGKIGRSDMVDSSGARSAAEAGRERLGIWNGTSSRRRTQKQKDRQQNGRGDAPGDEQLHHVPSASFKMAYSSSISSLVRAFSRAMEDTIRPTLPWYTRSRKERVSWRAAFSRSTAGK